jgi:hypothetical protein
MMKKNADFGGGGEVAWRSFLCEMLKGSRAARSTQSWKMGDPLFTVRNHFYLGAYNSVLNEAPDLDNLGDLEQVDRDVFVYRSYIAMGSYEVRLSEGA